LADETPSTTCDSHQSLRIYSIPATALNASTDFDRSKLADSHTAELDHYDAETIDTRLSDHQKLGHPSLKRMRHLDIEGLLIFKL
jgi:hypothetical protein